MQFGHNKKCCCLPTQNQPLWSLTSQWQTHAVLAGLFTTENHPSDTHLKNKTKMRWAKILHPFKKGTMVTSSDGHAALQQSHSPLVTSDMHLLYWGHITYTQKVTLFDQPSEKSTVTNRRVAVCLTDRYSLALIFRFHRLLCLGLQRSTEIGDRDRNKLRQAVWTFQGTRLQILLFRKRRWLWFLSNTACHIPSDSWGATASTKGKVIYCNFIRQDFNEWRNVCRCKKSSERQTAMLNRSGSAQC